MRHASFGNTSGFFDTLFSCDESLIDQIYGDLTSGDQPLYSKANKCWNSLPTNPTNVDSIYEPIVTIFSAITAACGSARMFNIVWQDVHSKKVNTEAAADVKPDIIGLLQACDSDSFDLWRLTQTFVEVKKPIAVLPCLLQILKYSRQALYEQVDRRFIFGLVYARTQLTLIGRARWAPNHSMFMRCAGVVYSSSSLEHYTNRFASASPTSRIRNFS